MYNRTVMKAGGSSTHGGINAQDWAAISLFFQNIVYTDFDYIGLEQPKLKDFNLVFTSGKKMICESKKLVVTYADIKEILDGIDENDLTERDEIVVICERVSKAFKSDLEWYKYFPESKERLEKKGFGEKHFKLFPRLSFYEVSREENEKIAYGLFAKLLGMWVPEKTLQEMVDSLVLQKIYFGSEAGTKYTKKEFYGEIEKRKKEIIAESGYYDEKQGKIKQIEEVYEALKKPEDKKDWSTGAIKSLTGSPEIHYQTVKKLKEKKDLDLKTWDSLWKASATSAFYFEVMDIFQNNSHIPANQEYLIEFLPSIIGKMIDPHRDKFYQVDISKICTKILEETRTFDTQIFEIIKLLLDSDLSNLLYKKTMQGERWEDEQICHVLKQVFEKTENAALREKIVEYIFQKFNLVDDSGEYWHHAAGDIFEILKLYAANDPETKIIELKKLLVQQLDAAEKKRYGKKSKYKGHESWAFSRDRHFVTLTLEPILTRYYEESPDKAWDFIQKECVTRDDKKLSADHPDFMNRMALAVLINEYKNGKNKVEAFNILSDFITMPTIPTKSDLILEKANQFAVSDDDLWNLILVQLEHPPFKGLPLDKTEELVIQLSNKGYESAVAKVAEWSQNDEYNNRKGLVRKNVIDSVQNLIENPETQKKALKIMTNYLNSDFFREELDTYKVWDVAKSLVKICRKDFQEGKKLIDEIWKQKTLTKNQQTLLSSIFGDVLKEESELVSNMYKHILEKWFEECENSPKKFKKIFTNGDNRESFVSFGEKLISIGNFEGALKIANMFIDDPNPSISNESDDPDGKSNLHERIKKGEYINSLRGVRAKICFMLQKVAITRGKIYIPQILPMVNKLITDPNLYVRSSACIPLQQLMRNKDAVVPETKTERFISVKNSEEISEIALNLFNSEENRRTPQLMQNIAEILDYLRTLNEKEAISVFDKVVESKDTKAISTATHTFLLYAEYRKEYFKSEVYKSIFGEKKWKELNKYEGKGYKKMFINYLRSKQTPQGIKSHFAWLLWRLPEEPKRGLEIAFEYFPNLLLEYEKRTFTNLYYFVKDYIESNYRETISLWKTAIPIERKYIAETLTEENFHDTHWLPYHYNGKILCYILGNEGESEFLKWLEYLLDYPEKALIAGDLESVVDKLIQLPITDETKRIFDKLVTRQTQFFDARKAWLTK